jgi:uncharacterized protein with ATP-grasp and redox domains
MGKRTWDASLKLDLRKELHVKAKEYLQEKSKLGFKSYSDAVATSVTEYFERHNIIKDDPYLETREKEDKFIEQVISAVERKLEKTLPTFLATCLAGMKIALQGVEMKSTDVLTHQNDDINENIDFDFLGG